MDYPLARTGFWAGASGLLLMLALIAPLCWWAWHRGVDPVATGQSALAYLGPMLLLLGIPAAGAFAWCRAVLRRVPYRHLRWDGAAWELRLADGEPLRLTAPIVRVDLGGALLLCAVPRQGGGARWLALERRELPAAWHALRVALFQRRSAEPTPPGAVR